MSCDITQNHMCGQWSHALRGDMSNNTLIKSSNLNYVAPVDDVEIVKTTTSCFPPSEIMDL